MGDIRHTPINEFNQGQALLSWAFPTLYPYGRGDIATPRLRTIPYDVYLAHCMRYHDGRFAQHPRFRFVAFNTLMRFQVNKKSSYYVTHNPDAPVDLDELQAAFHTDTREGRAILNSIVKFGDNLRRTRTFWNGKRHELEAYAYCLGLPAFSLTFSAADLHWKSLAKHMPRYDEWLAATEPVQLRISRENLRDNPAIAIHHFVKRKQEFMDKVLAPKFGITDDWHRLEFQGRGSGHDHGLAWVQGGIVPDLTSEQSRREFSELHGLHVSAMNPELNRAANQGEANILTTTIGEDEEPTFDALSRVVNRVITAISLFGFVLFAAEEAPRRDSL